MIPAPVKPNITSDLIEKIDIRVGTILAVADVPNSDNLVQLTVSFGDHQRTILSGMKQERTNPREIEGRQALFVVNLEPRKMAGEISEGTSISAMPTASRPCSQSPSSLPNGTRAG